MFYSIGDVDDGFGGEMDEEDFYVIIHGDLHTSDIINTCEIVSKRKNGPYHKIVKLDSGIDMDFDSADEGCDCDDPDDSVCGSDWGKRSSRKGSKAIRCNSFCLIPVGV